MTTSNTEFWDRVEALSAEHPLHSHRYFDYLLGARGDLAAVKVFSEQFYLFCVTFHRCLGAMVSNTSDEDIIAMIADNLYDEMGRGSLRRSHLEILKRFSRSIGYTEDDIRKVKPLDCTQELNDRILGICKADFYLGIGAAGLGAEFAGEKFFRRVYDSFRQKPFLKDADVTVYKIHAEDDTRHRQVMKDCLAKHLWNDEARERMLFGVEYSTTLFHNFWEGVGKASGFFKVARKPVPELPTVATAELRAA
jgi:pyrroloquinoline-quinone synthase